MDFLRLTIASQLFTCASVVAGGVTCEFSLV